MRSNARLSNALAFITAAVTGVFLNLATWFALHVVFTHVDRVEAGPIRIVAPQLATLRIEAVGIAIVSAWLLLRKKRSVLEVLAVAAGLGMVAALL